MINFKTGKEREDFDLLDQHNPVLKALLIDAGEFTMLMYGKPIVITSIHRDAAEQAELYKQSQVKVIKSAHNTWEAADLRSRTFTPEEIKRICEYLNLKYKNANGKIVAFCHRIDGNAEHFHCQLFH